MSRGGKIEKRRKGKGKGRRLGDAGMAVLGRIHRDRPRLHQ